MPRPPYNSLKGKNKWCRTDHESKVPTEARDTPREPIDPSPKAVDNQQPLQKIGRYALARDPSVVVKRNDKTTRGLSATRNTTGKDLPIKARRFTYRRPASPSSAPDNTATLETQPRADIKSSQEQSNSSRILKRNQGNSSVLQYHLSPNFKRHRRAGQIGGVQWRNKYIRPQANDEKLIQTDSDENKYQKLTMGEMQQQAHVLSKKNKVSQQKAGGVLQSSSHNIPRRSNRLQLVKLGGKFYTVTNLGKRRSLRLHLQQEEQGEELHRSMPSITDRARKSIPIEKKKISRTLPASAMNRTNALKREKSLPRLRGGRLIYCPIYCHTGSCPMRGRGCKLRHDPTKRSICLKWLKGVCTLGRKCPLQHQRHSSLMPTCLHFLIGRCTDTSCPFLHVKLASTATHCAAFLRGYCAAGANCASKHFTLKQIKQEQKLMAKMSLKKRSREEKNKEKISCKSIKKATRNENSDKKNMGDVVSAMTKRKRKKKRKLGRYFDRESSDEGEDTIKTTDVGMEDA